MHTHTHVHTLRFAYTKVSSNGCSQHHFTLKNGVYKKKDERCVLLSMSWQTTTSPVWILLRDTSPGSGPGCGQGSGRSKEGESLGEAPTRNCLPCWESEPVCTLTQPQARRWLCVAASSLFWLWPLPPLSAPFEKCSFLLEGRGARLPQLLPILVN